VTETNFIGLMSQSFAQSPNLNNRDLGILEYRNTMAKETMKAVVFKGPHKVAIEDRPIPKIQDQTDIIVKVMYTALCGRFGEQAHIYIYMRISAEHCVVNFMSSESEPPSDPGRP
jgi:hypothetical protein